MANAVEPLQALVSFDTVAVTVVQAGRSVQVETTAQQALSSVLGLVMATSGCPWTDHLRPMARFHLPFASEAETVYRSISMFLLAREINDGGRAQGFAGLQDLYRNLHVVNRDMSRRLGAATRQRPGAQCDGAARRLRHPAAGRARGLARGVQAVVRCMEPRENTAI